LYEEPEKPENPLLFLQSSIQQALGSAEDVATLKAENDALKQRIVELEQKVAELEKSPVSNTRFSSKASPVEQQQPEPVPEEPAEAAPAS
jgi:cell division protein FtsB